MTLTIVSSPPPGYLKVESDLRVKEKQREKQFFALKILLSLLSSKHPSIKTKKLDSLKLRDLEETRLLIEKLVIHRTPLGLLNDSVIFQP